MTDVRDLFVVPAGDEKMFDNLIKKLKPAGKDECWYWSAAINPRHKRPMFWFKSEWLAAARAVMYFKQGYLTPGMHVCHDPVKCNNKACVNPFHLREDTPSANTYDLVTSGNHNMKRKTHCPKGHEYTEDNIYKYNNKRHCRTCIKEKGKQRKKK